MIGRKLIMMISLLLAASFIYSDDKTSIDDPTIVDDQDKTSGRVNDLITSVETATKAIELYNTVKDGKKVVDEVKKFKNLKDIKGTVKDKIKGTITQYKSTKWSLFKWVSDVSNRMADVMESANDRINMWRTTEPMLLNYYKSMGRVTDNTLEVFRDFELSDMIDIDREWSKKMEKQLNQDKNLVYSFLVFSSKQFPDEYHRKRVSSMFMEYSIEDELTGNQEDLDAYMEMKDNVHQFNRIPYRTMAYATDALLSVREISQQSHKEASGDKSVTEEQYYMELVSESLQNPNATYNDIVDNGALIDTKRSEVSLQRAQLKQIITDLQSKYSRLLMRRKERMAIEYEEMDNTLEKLINGGDLQQIEIAETDNL